MNSSLPPQKNNSDKTTSLQVSSSVSAGKEKEFVTGTKSEMPSVPSEVEIPKEVERVGVKNISGTIELPPDIRKIGVTSPASSLPVQTVVSNIPSVVLPITDSQVVLGLHQKKVSSALKWMAVWCIKKLKKAHIALKVIHGKIRRVRV